MTDNPFTHLTTEALEAEILRRQTAQGGEPITPAMARKLSPQEANRLWNDRIRRDCGHGGEQEGSNDGSLVVRAPRSLIGDVALLAARNDRTASEEARIALAAHVARNDDAEVVKTPARPTRQPVEAAHVAH